VGGGLDGGLGKVDGGGVMEGCGGRLGLDRRLMPAVKDTGELPGLWVVGRDRVVRGIVR